MHSTCKQFILLFTLRFVSASTSVCQAGQWLCTGERCAAQCMLIGALQITTFDRKRYSLQGGDCTFTAVEVRHNIASS